MINKKNANISKIKIRLNALTTTNVAKTIVAIKSIKLNDRSSKLLNSLRKKKCENKLKKTNEIYEKN